MWFLAAYRRTHSLDRFAWACTSPFWHCIAAGTCVCGRYANRAKNIKNKPKINEDPKDALLREFQEEIARLKAALEVKGGGGGGRKKRGRKEPRTGPNGQLFATKPVCIVDLCRKMLKIYLFFFSLHRNCKNCLLF